MTQMMQQETIENNVVHLADFLPKKQPAVTPQKIKINGVEYSRPTSGDEYLKFVKAVMMNINMEAEYKEVLCMIMDEEYYQANFAYYQTPNGKADKHYPLYQIVDTFLTYST